MFWHQSFSLHSAEKEGIQCSFYKIKLACQTKNIQNGIPADTLNPLNTSSKSSQKNLICIERNPKSDSQYSSKNTKHSKIHSYLPNEPSKWLKRKFQITDKYGKIAFSAGKLSVKSLLIQKLKLIEHDEFNYLINTLALPLLVGSNSPSTTC